MTLKKADNLPSVPLRGDPSLEKEWAVRLDSSAAAGKAVGAVEAVEAQVERVGGWLCR